MGRRRYAKENNEIELLRQLASINQTIRAKEIKGHPGSFGLPDLLFPQGFKQGVFEPENPMAIDGWVRESIGKEETPAEYALRQDVAIKAFVEKYLYIVKDANKIDIKLIAPMIRFIGDIVFRRISRAILWKSRGSGGSLCSAIIIFLLMVYHKRSVLSASGSEEQSAVIYSYVVQFLSCIPRMNSELVDGAPLMTKTSLVTGAIFKAIPSSEKQSRGKHVSVVFVDEASGQQEHTEKAMEACIQGALSEKDPIIIMLSTFHNPKGLFADTWDGASEKGYTQYNWNVIDSMQQCSRGLDKSTPEDPLALSFCRKCYLTHEKLIIGEGGGKGHQAWGGCHGKARNSRGWFTFEQACEAKRTNEGNDVWVTEFLNQRPSYRSLIYDPELVDEALVENESLANALNFSVGIDWGHESANSMVMMLGVRKIGYVYVAECLTCDHKLIGEIADMLKKWQDVLTPGQKIPIWADRSHPFNNAELAARDFDIRPVDFGTMKSPGIANLIKYFVHRRIKINKKLDLFISQMKSYRRNENTGKPVKLSDHTCDAGLCLFLNWEFESEFGPDLVINTSREPSRNNKVVPTFISDGLSTAGSNPFDFEIPKGYERIRSLLTKEKRDVMLF
jgi:hypothetical protein